MLTKRINQLQDEQKNKLNILLSLANETNRHSLNRRYNLKHEIKDLHNRLLELKKHLN